MSACIGRKHKQLTILSKYNGRCGYCGEIDYLNIDHILPKSKGGTDRYENLTPSCENCNLCKQNMVLEQFRTEIALRLNIKENLGLLYRENGSIKIFDFEPHWEKLLTRFAKNDKIVFWMDNH